MILSTKFRAIISLLKFKKAELEKTYQKLNSISENLKNQIVFIENRNEKIRQNFSKGCSYLFELQCLEMNFNQNKLTQDQIILNECERKLRTAQIMKEINQNNLRHFSSREKRLKKINSTAQDLFEIEDHSSKDATFY